MRRVAMVALVLVAVTPQLVSAQAGELWGKLRAASKIVEAAYAKAPHPDLAQAYDLALIVYSSVGGADRNRNPGGHDAGRGAIILQGGKP